MSEDVVRGSSPDLDAKLVVNGVSIDVLFNCRVKRSPRFRLILFIKRAVDLLLGSALLVLASPLLAFAGAVIVLTSKGGILYSGERCGVGGKPFACLKLRTMYVNQEELLRASGLDAAREDGTLMVFASDPRITPLGRWLRKLSIDELPQLWNVVKGDMSLIGPRALAVSMLEQFPRIKVARSVMRPGITGLWQVRGRRKNAAVADMIADDVEYIFRFNLFLDMKIAWLTLPKIVEPSVTDKSG
jgi:exopolysaccharide production protein ExoY